MLKYPFLMLVMIMVSACAKSHADGLPTAKVIASPMAGYTCFAFVNDAGQAMNGTCVKD